MAERKVYHVNPSGRSWKVEREGGSRPEAVSEDKDQAIERARELATSGELGQVIIHRQDGTIEKEYTYGKDPRSKPG
jgi:hypothetical protein